MARPAQNDKGTHRRRYGLIVDEGKGNRMTGFDEREKGFERKFERDQELAFKVKARRNHLLGLWAAEHLGLKGTAAEHYARAITDPSQHLHGDAEIVKKIAADFKAKSIALDAHRVRLEIERLTAEAKKQLGAGKA